MIGSLLGRLVSHEGMGIMRGLAMAVSIAFLWGSVIGFAGEHTKDSLEQVRKNLVDQKAVLVDVRELDEWHAGHLEKAISIPLSQLNQPVLSEEVLKKLSKDRIVYTYCAAGRRSVLAANVLEGKGYDVRPLKPGYQQLLKEGFAKEPAER